MKKYYVYTYTDPRTLKCFYVGKGTGQRHRYHWNKRSHNKGVNSICNQLRSHDLSPIITKYPCDDEQMAYDFEILLIKKYGRVDLGTGTLCNLTKGGDGGLEVDRQNAIKKKIPLIPQNQKDKIRKRGAKLQIKHKWTDIRRRNWETSMLARAANQIKKPTRTR